MKPVQVLAGFTLVLGVLAFAGHAFGISALLSVRPGAPAISIVTASCVIVLSLALFAGSRGRHGIAMLLSGGVVVLPLLVLTSYLLRGVDDFSLYLSHQVLHLTGIPEVPGVTGRTSRSTAMALICVALAVLFSGRPRVTHLGAGLAIVLSTIALLGNTYGVRDLELATLFNNMALQSAVAVFALAIGSMMLRPDLGWPAVVASSYAAGGATRRQLAFTLMPPVVGWVLMQAVHAGRLDIGAAMALLVMATIIPLALLVLKDGRSQIALEEERRSKNEALAAIMAQARQRLVDQSRQLQDESAERAKVEAAMYRAQRMEAVGHLTGGIAHDFNNLLMTISGNVQLLKRKMAPGDPLAKYIYNLSSAVSKGSKVTQQLLAFSRSQKLSIVPTAMESVVVSARELIGNSLGPEVALRISLDAPEAWALCDADQLELSLLNLAVNSRDAMPRGGVIEIRCERSQMPSSGEPGVRVRVNDDGEGMTPEVMARAAEPFFTTKEKGKGTGLGLAQVYGFVTQCGGEFVMSSEVGVGATIDMYFPAAAPAPVQSASQFAAMEATLPATQRRVVVIDDDDSVREVIVQGLRDSGYLVSEARDGESGLQRIEDFGPVAVVIDFLMPGLNGAEVAKIAQARHPKLPIVFVSGYSDTLMLDGVSGALVLRKPFDMQTLHRALSSVIEDA
jgi:signal transduction histidine kinase